MQDKGINMIDNYYSYLQRQALSLMQALLGVITPNFRMVWLSADRNGKVIIYIILEHMSDDDMEEIDDLESEYEALQEKPTDYYFDVIISNEFIKWPHHNSIVVYKRKEQ